MKHKSYMTIGEFARITGLKRANLIFYDNIGLLSPDFRGDNAYRYYTRQQLGSAYLIQALRELGLGLEEIRFYAKGRTPEKWLLLLADQKKKIRYEIYRLRQMSEIMSLYTNMAEKSLQWNVDEIVVKQMEREPIFLGPPVDSNLTDDESSIDFYQYAANKGMNLGYPLGCIISKSVLEHNRSQPIVNTVSCYYFKVGQEENAYKPEGLYAIACGYCGYGQDAFICERIMHYIAEHKLRLCGDAYVEYPLNEMAIDDDNRYFAMVAIMVEYI